jgi:D-alanyl-D-alanine carboxypeptidase (penicillin-binding protein 5/6)
LNGCVTAHTDRRPRRIRWDRVAGLIVVVVAIAVALGSRLPSSPSSSAATTTIAQPPRTDGSAPGASPSGALWPVQGQAAYVLDGSSRIRASGSQVAAPIASVAKVMTAYIVLRDHPLRLGEDGPAITLTAADVDDTDRRRRQDESIVPVADGEVLSEREALIALLLPSANNVAAVLARWDAASEGRFVARMNAAARALGMTRTRYTDPSGYDPGTVSTATDQVRLVLRALGDPVFAGIVALPSATLPVAGTVANTDRLLGHDGFVGVKTGSDSAAGGCFAFRAIRLVGGRRRTITGVVLGQPGGNALVAGLEAADDLVDRIADR